MATAKQDPKDTSKAKTELRTIEALVVKSVAKGFRRIGLAFTREAVHLDPSLLQPEQVAALKAEPGLVVTTAKVSVPVSGTKPANAVVTPVAPAAAADNMDAE